MRVVVFSDSHGLIEFALRAVKREASLDFLLHAGDHYRDGVKLAEKTGLPTKVVVGNCDSFVLGPAEEFFELAGRRIILVHGHQAGVNISFRKLLAKAVEYGAEAVVYGHTHLAKISYEKGILLFNPGSITMPRDHNSPSYGILEISEQGIKPFIYRL